MRMWIETYYEDKERGKIMFENVQVLTENANKFDVYKLLNDEATGINELESGYIIGDISIAALYEISGKRYLRLGSTEGVYVTTSATFIDSYMQGREYLGEITSVKVIKKKSLKTGRDFATCMVTDYRK
mgnify:CR=1 FL=1